MLITQGRQKLCVVIYSRIKTSRGVYSQPFSKRNSVYSLKKVCCTYGLCLASLFSDILGHIGTHVDEEAGSMSFLINILLLEDCSSRRCHLDLYIASRVY
jgi:hypothetical protein